MNLIKRGMFLFLLLDVLSSRFDTVDHEVLLRGLNVDFGIKARFLEGFRS